MKIEQNRQLLPLNTFRVSARAAFYCEINSLEDLRAAIDWNKTEGRPLFILGGGSNVLFTGDTESLVLHVRLRGLDQSVQQDGSVLLSAAAGECWKDVVDYAVSQGLGGIENLSSIPGSIGAAPVQNVGAYGVEFKDVCESVTALCLNSGEVHFFAGSRCAFGYRDSFFKQNSGQWVVLSTTMRLQTGSALQLDYGNIRNEVEEMTRSSALMSPDYATVAQAVSRVRDAKLPDPADPSAPGSGGSFFKNPVIPADPANDLRKRYPAMPFYPQSDGSVKLSAAWLLDQAGWKGVRCGDVGCYPQQPLVLVNYGQATGAEILHFSESIQADIQAKFGVNLQREVVVHPE